MRHSVYLGLFVSLLASACQTYPFSFRENQRTGGRRYELPIGVSEKTDVLFVIDNSGSMAEEQAELSANVSQFINLLSRSTNDYQVGLISTDIFRKPVPADTTCSPCCDVDLDGDSLPDWTNCDDGRLYAFDFQNRVFRRPVLTDEELETLENPEEELQNRVDQFVDDFNATITSLGTTGTAYEAPLEAMRRALDPEGDKVVQYLNRGFLREDASLAVIFLTDEDDCSFPNEWYEDPLRDDSECYYSPEAIPPSEFVDFLVDLKGTVEAVRAAAIIGGIAQPDPAPDELGFVTSGCYTIADAADGPIGDPSAACGCWTARFKTDTREGYSGDFFCNMLSEDPFGQTSERLPSSGMGQGGCRSLHASRVQQFVDEILSRRIAAGLPRGVLVDSICRADYGETLRNIASAVALTSCFFLRERPQEGESVIVSLNGTDLPQVVEGSGTVGWFHDEERNAVCLENLEKEVGDLFEIYVLSETLGFEP